MTEVAVIVPVLARPQAAQPLADSLHAATTVTYRLVFVCSPDDHAQIDACQATNADVLVADWQPGHADFARKVQLAYEHTEEPYLFQAGDDVRFHTGWDTEALTAITADTGYGVCGTNDNANPLVRRGHHSTHSLIERGYIDECGASADGPGTVFSLAYWHQWCCTPEAPVWMSDLSFRPISDVEVGDEVMGWRRLPSLTGQTTLNRLSSAEVLAVGTRRAEVVKITMKSGRVLRCTPDHSWLNPLYNPSGGKRQNLQEWVTAEPGRLLLRVANIPAECEHPREAGWLGGIYDGEGTGVYVATQSPTKNPGVVAEIERCLDLLEIPYTRAIRASDGFGSSADGFMLKGGRQAYLRFLLTAQPVKREKLVAKIMGGARYGMRDRVVSVKPDGTDDVISLTTTTGNYTAWGFASKNCDNELVALARQRGCFTFAARSLVTHVHPIWGTAPDDETYRKGALHAGDDARLFQERRRLWEAVAA